MEKRGPSYTVSWHRHYGEQYESSSKTVSCSVVSNSLQPHGPSPVYGILQARILEWVSHSFIQGIFPTQGSKPCLLHGRWILYYLSHQGSPWRTVQRFLKKLKIELPYDPEIPLLGTYPKKVNQKGYIYPSFHCCTIYNSQHASNLCLLKDEWIKKWCVCVCIYTHTHIHVYTHIQ